MIWRKIFRRLVVTFIILSTLLFAAVSHAETQTYTGEGVYIMSEGENLGVSKERAKADAMRNACEKAGVYVEGRTEVRKLQVTKDEIITMTSNILKLIEEPHFYPLEELDNLEGIKIRVTVKAQIDDSDITRWLNKDSKEKDELVAQNEALRKANEAQERQIAELKRQLAQSKTKEDKERITKEFANEDKIFLSNQKVEEATRFWENAKYEDAIKLCNEAIELNPNNEFAYLRRGVAYNGLKQNEHAIQDCNKAIKLNPNFMEAYNNRGNTYQDLGQYERAIQDFDKSIQINSNYAEAYNNRGNTYQDLGQYERAIQDFDKAIKFTPNNAETYQFRGLCYQYLGEYAKA